MRFQAWHIIVLVVAFILLFGWKNLPNAARSLGQSMRVFKSEVDQMKDEHGRHDSGATAADADRRLQDRPLGRTADRPLERTDEVHDRYRDTAQDDYRRLGESDRHDPRDTDPRV